MSLVILASEFTHNKFKHSNVIRIQSTFDVKLKEHKIKRPEILWQKLADTVTVTIDAFANGSIKTSKKCLNFKLLPNYLRNGNNSPRNTFHL